jgi:hypothetical protein
MLAHTPYAVGDRVRFRIGGQMMRGTISEDRGALGVGGRRIYGVLVASAPYELEPAAFELPEDELSPAPEDSPLTEGEIRDYLVNDGLVSILQGALRGGRPRAWLCRDSLGQVTHTFGEEFGRAHGVGGEPIPFAALQREKIARSMRPAVVEYLGTFGLSRQAAEGIVEAVGVAG